MFTVKQGFYTKLPNSPQQWSVLNGTPTISSAQALPWASTSGNFSNSGAQTLRTTNPYPAFNNVGTSDFTWEAWVYAPTLPPAARELWTTEVTAGMGVRLGRAFSSAQVQNLSLYARGSQDQNFGAITLTATTWTYLVIQRSATKVEVWYGNLGAGTASYTDATSTFTGGTAVGYNYANANVGGGVILAGFGGTTTSSNLFFGEVRMSNIARYTQVGGVNIPTTFLPFDNNTTQLLQFQNRPGSTAFLNTTNTPT